MEHVYDGDKKKKKKKKKTQKKNDLSGFEVQYLNILPKAINVFLAENCKKKDKKRHELKCFIFVIDVG